MLLTLLLAVLPLEDAGATPPRERVRVIVIKGSGNAITKPHVADLDRSLEEEGEAIRDTYPRVEDAPSRSVSEDGKKCEARWRVVTPVGFPDLVIVVPFELRAGRWYSGSWRVDELRP